MFRGAKSQISSSSLSTNLGSLTLPIEKTLIETNTILVEIQKQLAFDYAMRIAEEKDAIKSIKAAESKRKFAAKESSIEGIKKIGGAVGGTINKIAAPIKGIFDRIKEFFGLILTSLVASAAFKWLEDENNVTNLINTFEFIGKTLPFLLGGLLTYKLIKWGRRLFLLGRFFKRLPGKILRGLRSRFKLKPKPGLKPKPTLPGFGSLSPKSGSLSSLSKGQSVAPRPGAGTILGPGGKPIMGSGIDAFRGGTAGRAPSIPKPGQGITTKITPGNLRSILNFKNLRSFGIGLLLEYAGSFVINSAFNAIDESMFNNFVKKYNSSTPKEKESIARELLRKIEKEVSYQDSFLHAKDKLLAAGGTTHSERVLAKYARRLQAIGFNEGGTVPGKGSGSVDSVNAMLAPGEEVVKTASARLFRPLLKDINDNAGRLWSAFSMGIDKLMMVSKQQEDVNKEFARVIEDQEKYQRDLKTEKILKKVEGRGGGYRSPAKITPKAPRGGGNISMIPQSSGGMIFQPMVLPTQRSKPPQIPEMSGPATQAPNIAAANPANPYMMLTPELYGIMV